MKKITLTAVLFALCFATGFTCSKNAPQQTAQPVESTTTTTTTTTPPAATPQETMAVPPAPADANGTALTTTTTTTTAPAVQPTSPEAHK